MMTHINKHCLTIMLMLTMSVQTIIAAVNCVVPMKMGNTFVTPNSTSFKVRVTNYGSADVHSLFYSLINTDLQQQIGQDTIRLDSALTGGETRTIDIAATPSPDYSKQSLLLNITLVNGQYNEATSPYTYIDLYTVTRIPKKRYVVEEYTGMWCGYCPRGMVTLEYLSRTFPDEFIPIAIHCRNGQFDILDTGAYSTLRSNYAAGFPALWLNRRTKINDWIEGASILSQKNDAPPAMDVEAVAIWQNDSNDIAVTTTLNPCAAVDTSKYGIAYVLTEDGLTSPNWAQRNYLSGEVYNNAPEELKQFTEGGSWVYNLKYNHTAIVSAGEKNGVSPGIQQALIPDVEQQHSYTFGNISQYSIIQCKDSLHVVVLLINRESGEIENAAKCRVVNESEIDKDDDDDNKKGDDDEQKGKADTVNCVEPWKIGAVYATPQTTSVKVRITNRGETEVRTLYYVLTDTVLKKPVSQDTIRMDSVLAVNDTCSIDIPITPSEDYSKQSLVLNISLVNGQENKAQPSTVAFDVYTISHFPKKRYLVEEYTGMWNGEAPRGMLMMEKLSHEFPDDFIGISIHCSSDCADHLDTGAYADMRNNWASKIPSMYFNRKACDWEEACDRLMYPGNTPVAMDVDVAALWQNDSTDIQITATVTPCVPADTGKFGIAYVLTEDGMSAAGWAQKNSFCGKTTYYYNPVGMETFIEGDSIVYGLTYNNVAIAALGERNGLTSGFTEPLKPEAQQEHSAMLSNIRQYSAIQNKDSLSIVAIIINRETGEVENVAKCRIIDDNPEGISEISEERKKATPRRYNLYGLPVGNDYKGIVIEGGKKKLIN